MNIEQKDELLSAVKRHAEMDMLIQGCYGVVTDDVSSFKGCSIGCIAADHGVFADQHKFISKHYAYPEWLVCLQDYLFEAIGIEVHTDLVSAMRPRVDWMPIEHAIHWRILTEVTLPKVDGETYPDIVKAINDVAALHIKHEPSESAAWSAAESAAESAAWSAAESAWSAAESAAWSARSATESAWSAAESARSAAWSATESAWSAAESARSAANQQIYKIVLDEVAS